MKNQMKLLVILFILIFHSLQLQTQQKQIKGTSTGKSLLEAALMIKGSIKGIITDFDENFLYFQKTLQSEKDTYVF